MKYEPRLNAVRGIAVASVLLHHFASFNSSVIHAGYFGVDIFFVLSGFLITGILISKTGEGQQKILKDFYGRRALRIFPIYYGSILLLYLANDPFIRSNIVPLLTYTYNYTVIHEPSHNRYIYFWSLSVEEQFYLFWPLIVTSFLNFRKTLCYLTLTIIVISAIQLSTSSRYNYFGTFPVSYSLCIGALGALLQNQKLFSKVIAHKPLQLSAILILCGCFFVKFPLVRFLLPLATIILLSGISNSSLQVQKLAVLLDNKLLQKTGMVAYGIYVFHIPLAHYVFNPLFDKIWLSLPFNSLGRFAKLQWHPWIFKLPLFSIGSYYFSLLSFNYFEKPILKLKDKYFN